MDIIMVLLIITTTLGYTTFAASTMGMHKFTFISFSIFIISSISLFIIAIQMAITKI